MKPLFFSHETTEREIIIMVTVGIAILCFFGYIVAYNTYGRWLARKIFALNPDSPTPSHTCEDGIDYVPTNPMIFPFSSFNGAFFEW